MKDDDERQMKERKMNDDERHMNDDDDERHMNDDDDDEW